MILQQMTIQWAFTIHSQADYQDWHSPKVEKIPCMHMKVSYTFLPEDSYCASFSSAGKKLQSNTLDLANNMAEP